MIDIDHLDLEGLYALNDRVVERIKFFQHARAHMSMIAFNIGARVSFESAEDRQFGRLVKYNTQSIRGLMGQAPAKRLMSIPKMVADGE